MDKSVLHNLNKRNNIIISIIIGISVLFALMLLVFEEGTHLERAEKLNTLNDYVEFQSYVEEIFHNNTNLLRAYIAYIQTIDNFNIEETEVFLDNLLIESENIIKNVSVIEDTTIFYTYPSIGNEKVLGVDLALIPEQRDIVLEVKKSRNLYFQGPIDLVQGGIGIIARVPIIIDDEYYGQTSIVLDGDKFIEDVTAFGEEIGLKVAFFENDDYPNVSFTTDDLLPFEDNPISRDFNLNGIDWKILAVSNASGNSSQFFIWAGSFIALTVSIIISLLIYRNLISQMKIEEQANTDHLTGLYNRNFMFSYQKLALERSIRTNTKLSVIMFDLDNFKSMNDTYGHKFGDEVLIAFSKRLVENFRGTEAIFRLGGDEFLVLLPHLQRNVHIDIIMARVINELHEPYLINGHTVELYASYGVGNFPEDGLMLEDIMIVADNKMYVNKNEHKKVGI